MVIEIFNTRQISTQNVHSLANNLSNESKQC